MDKMDGMTMDIEQANVEKLKEVFPEVFADGKVDFDKLQGLLGHYIADDKEKYSFSWKGKADSLRLAQKRSTGTLRPCKDESKDWDTTENLYIEGDNLEVLKLLQSSYLNSVKMIYIDPPYNTGNDFVYIDDFADGIAHYKEVTGQATKSNPETAGRYHTNWLNMMYPRLKLARNLLTDDGVIFISIDEREFANLKKISDEVFGEKNYFGDLVWESTTQPINAGNARFGLQKKTEIILFYGKNKQENKCFILHELESSLNYPHDGKHGKCRFEIIEKSDAGDYSRPSMRFQILGQFPREGKRWQVGEDLARKLEKEGKVEIIDGIVKRAIYPEDEIDKRQFKPFWSLFSASEVGTAQTGKEELNSLFNKQIGFDTVKPVSLIKKLIYHVSASLNSDIILDFFSGSATTAHAVMQLNAEDGGNRKFIMVQLPEKCDEKSEAYKAGYKNICEIGKERIRRAGEKIKEENKDKKGIESLDVGFKVFKLDSSNLIKWDNTPTTDEEEVKNRIKQLSMDYLVDGRSDLDLVYEIMLKYGLPLTLPVEERNFDGVPAYIIHHPDYKVLVCLEPDITLTAVEEMDKEPIGTYIFADRCFADANILSNTEEILKKKDKEMRLF